jgi:HD-GYP domain-containing protein (c-di-GMP phosphodiesterase class II)
MAMNATSRQSTDEVAGYLQVALSTLLPDRVLDVRLYIRDSSAAAPRLYRGANVSFERKDLDRLIASGLSSLYININDYTRYQSYLRSHLPEILKDERISVNERFATLNAVVRDVLASSFLVNDVDRTVEVADEMAAHCVELMSREDCVAGEIIRLLSHDYQTFTHSANVAYCCVLLAGGLGVSDPAELKAVAVGGFLHDVGKLDIPDYILNKPRTLTDQEARIVKAHPGNGFMRLCHREDLTFSQLMMVYQHHERVDGRGYPVGCGNDELHDWSRLCAVASAFDVLTTNRSSRARHSAEDVVRVMGRESGKAYDEETLQCWKNVIARNS